jgi:3'5'-cyclic nucleotide phosphodiesterase
MLIMKMPVALVDVTDFNLKESDKILDTFDFNVLEYSEPMDKHRLVWALLKRRGYLDKYNIPNDELSTFLRQLFKKYSFNNNPFHNYDHGITVMQSTHVICGFVEELETCESMDNFAKFTLILSALCHDVDHTGRTNVYEINSLSKLAIRYHDKSVLEQHHAATAIKIIQEDESNILVNIAEEDFRKFRRMFI